MRQIDTMDQWTALATRLRANGYRLWQSQYTWDMPAGYNAWFTKPGKDDFEVVTYSKEVQDAIVVFNSSGV